MNQSAYKNKVGLFLVVNVEEHWGIGTVSYYTTADINNAFTGIIPYQIRREVLKKFKPVNVKVASTRKVTEIIE